MQVAWDVVLKIADFLIFIKISINFLRTKVSSDSGTVETNGGILLLNMAFSRA